MRNTRTSSHQSFRELKAAGESGKLVNVMPEGNDRGFESRFPPLCFNFGFWGPNNGDRHRAYVYLYIREPKRPRAEEIFERLTLHETAMNAELRKTDPSFMLNQWSPHTGSPNPQADYCSVGMQIDGTVDDPPEKLAEIRAWMLAFYPALKRVMDPNIEEVLRSLP